MKKVLLIILILILTCLKFQEKENIITIPSDSIRLRVISNSNSEFDIQKKMELKEYIESYLYDLIKDCNSKEEVSDVILNNFDLINNKIAKYLNNNNFKVDYGQNYFPAKTYKGVIYEEGLYDSLVITIGNGKGSNWWCVLFPPLCLIEDNDNTTDVEYQFFVSRIIDYFK